MIRKKIFKLSIILILISYWNVYANAQNKWLNEQNEKGIKLIKLWDSIDKSADYVIDPFKIEAWGSKFEYEYYSALKRNEKELAFQLSIPLSYIYHSETKFNKGMPLLKNLLNNKNKINKKELELVLIKLEEEYRATNDIENAIIIRKERISNHFINNYWEIYRDCGLFEAAKKDLLHFQKIPAAYTTQRLSYYFLLGDLFMQMKEFDSAKNIYQIGLEAAKNTIIVNNNTHQYAKRKLLYWEACFMGLIAKSNIEKGDFKNAIGPLKYDISQSDENTDNKIEKMLALSKCYIYFNNLTQARVYLDSAKELFSEKISKTIQLTYLLTSSEYYKSINKNDSALFFYHAYNNYRDTLNNKIQKNQSILLLVQLEVANRRSELLESKQSLIDSNKQNNQQKTLLLILLFFLIISITVSATIYLNSLANTKSKNKIQAQSIMINAHSEKIEAQFNHNEILLKELHHRVKNNLQVMYSLLNLQKRRNKDTDTIETLSAIQNRIQTMALVHQNLYNSGDFEMVEVLNYITTLANHLSLIYKVDKQKIDIQFEIKDALKLPIETVVAIGLIVNEAVSNSFKYAFKHKENGRILIKIESGISEIEIVIQDNGNGIKEENTKENSLGMKLIKLMCLQLKATHTLEKINGVKHHIKFNKV
jgi:two-component sensor histidine kinase